MPPKKRKSVTGGTATFKGEFSFVNKDASNIDNKDHSTAVSWHVMNRYEKWKKQEQAKKSKTPATTSVAVPESEPTSSVFTLHPRTTLSESSPLGQELPQDQQSGQTTPQYPPDPWHIESVEQSVQEQRLEDFTMFNQNITTALPYPIATQPYIVDPEVLRADETSNSNSQFSPLINRVARFVHEVIIPNTWPEEIGRARWTYEISRAMDEISSICSDVLFASASLCLHATLLASVTHDTELASEACFWQMQAMGELRHRIQTDSGRHNFSTFRAILKLFSAETALDNTATARVHLKMLRTLVQAQGGVILLDSWFRENLLAADCYFALKCETRPLFPASEWTPGSLSQPWRASIAATEILGDHTPAVGAAVEHVQLRAVITDLRELFDVEKYVDAHNLQADDQLLRWRQLRKFDCVNRLADHQLNVKLFPHLYREPRLHAAICTAIALMISMVLAGPEPVRFGVKLVEDLKVRLQDVRATMEESAPFVYDSGNTVSSHDVQNVIFWMLHVGTLAENLYASYKSPDIRAQFEEILTELGLHTEQEQETVKRQFLFSPVVEEEILTGRPRRLQDTIKGIYEACGTSWRQPNAALQSM